MWYKSFLFGKKLKEIIKDTNIGKILSKQEKRVAVYS